jgi:glycosyltransferase involved in cell wall biosynthesis
MLRTYLENKYFPKLDYLTASSPQIATAYRQLFPDKNPVALLNVFPSVSNILAPAYNPDGPVKLFWFSQTIGIGRGLEEIIEALQLLKDHPFEFHLLGYLPAETKTSFIDPLIGDNYSNIHFHDPIPSDQIAAFASQFDIGLALERHEPYNRDICLTNKIFTCIQAGLAIVASDTKAQSELLSEHTGIGKIYQKGNPQALAGVLLYYHQNRDQLFETRKAALKIAKEQFNWEKESKKFLALVKQTPGSN